jgi:germination protein M
MRKWVFVLVAGCLIFSGCGVIKEVEEVGEHVPVSKIEVQVSESRFRVQKTAVYFYNETSDTLTAEIRSLVIGQDENPAKAAIEALLAGPNSESNLLGVAPESMSLDFIEFSRNIANVYLTYYGGVLEPEQKYTLELAIVNTVTDILGAEYVNVFHNGVFAGFSGNASAPLEKQAGSISDAWAQTSAEYIEVPEATAVPDDTQTPLATAVPVEEEPEQIDLEPESNDILTVLYFVSEDGGYILPEVRNVTYLGENYIESLIEELKKGPSDLATMKNLLPPDIELLSPPLISQDNNRVALNFSELPTVDAFSDEEYVLSYAALIYTITGFMPNVRSIDLSVLGQPISDFDGSVMFADGMQRNDYYGYIGSSAPIYFTDKSSDLLLVVQRSMEQGSTWSAKRRVFEILRGPLSGDTASAWPVMPAGVSQDDILSVITYEDTLFVDISQNFKDACVGMSPKNEMLLVYSIVNTLTAMDGIIKVQFLVEGKQTDTLAGTICLSDPFLKNFGIIK